MLSGVAAVFLATGYSIRLALLSVSSQLADAVLILAVLITLLWASLYYSLRVSAHAVVSEAGLMLVHGPWKHLIRWNDVERLSEWAVLNEGFRSQWMALWSSVGMRLQIRQDLVTDYQAFRTDVLRHLAAPHDPPASVADLSQTYSTSADVGTPLRTWGTLLVIELLGAAVIFVIARDLWPIWSLLGITALTGLLSASMRQMLRQQVTVDHQGVVSRRAFSRIALSWDAIYALDREIGTSRSKVWGLLRRSVVMLVFRVDPRSGVVPATEHLNGTILISGGTGQHIRIHEQLFPHPGWLRARLRNEVEALRANATTPPKVKPLAPTGPLAKDVVLPPDPLEGASTLWLRESGFSDPFRIEK